MCFRTAHSERVSVRLLPGTDHCGRPFRPGAFWQPGRGIHAHRKRLPPLEERPDHRVPPHGVRPRALRENGKRFRGQIRAAGHDREGTAACVRGPGARHARGFGACRRQRHVSRSSGGHGVLGRVGSSRRQEPGIGFRAAGTRDARHITGGRHAGRARAGDGLRREPIRSVFQPAARICRRRSSCCPG